METSPREWGEILYQTPWENRESEKRVNKMNFQSKSIHSCTTGNVEKLWIGSVPFQQIKQRFWGLTFVTYSLSVPCYRHYNISVRVTGWKRGLLDCSKKGSLLLSLKNAHSIRDRYLIFGAHLSVAKYNILFGACYPNTCTIYCTHSSIRHTSIIQYENIANTNRHVGIFCLWKKKWRKCKRFYFYISRASH